MTGPALVPPPGLRVRGYCDRCVFHYSKSIRSIPVLTSAQLQELSTTWRGLLRKPSYLAIVLLLLVLGIGVNTAIFSLLEAVFRHPLPVPRTDELVGLYQTTLSPAGEPQGFGQVSYPNYRDLRERSRSFSALGLYQWEKMNLAGGSQPDRIAGAFATSSYFEALGIQPALGRFFRPEEDLVPGAAPVLVLSHGCWQRLFGGDAAILGRKITLDGKPFTVVGVAPRGFKGTELGTRTDAWIPSTMFPVVSAYAPMFMSRDDYPFRVVGRLRPGVSLAAARAEMASLARELVRQFPKENERMGIRLLPLVEAAIIPRERERYLGWGRNLSLAAMLLLLVVCTNLANLLLGRGLDRRRELAIRQAVGADPARISRLLGLEALSLFVLGALLSLPVGVWSLHLLWSFRPPELAAGDLDLSLDPAMLGATLLVVLASMLCAGLLPVLAAARRDLVANLTDVHAGGRQQHRLFGTRRLLVVLQVALTLLALSGADLLLRGLIRLRQSDLGFQPERLLALTVSPGDQGYDEARARDYYREILERVSVLPGVRAAALSENRLLRGAVRSRAFWPEGQDHPIELNGRASHRTNAVTPGFFRTAGIALVRGRDFSEADCARCQPVAIINQTAARLAWNGQDAIGREFRFEKGAPLIKVIGVAHDAKYRDLHEAPLVFVYLPLSQNHVQAMTLHVQTARDPEALLPAVRRTARALDPAMPLAEADTMAHFLTGSLWIERASTLLLGLFGLLAFVVSAIGIHSVATLSVARRRREIGIRLALGAQRVQVLGGVIAESVLLVAAGLLLGGVAAWLLLKPVVATQVRGADLGDPGVYALQALLLLVMAIAAGSPAALRAGRIDPVRSLREP
jgi:macrolide transport system ATP-binding/permease protein